jgi:hypothetical protein
VDIHPVSFAMNYETVKHVKLCHLFCLDVGGDKLSDLYSVLF